MEQNMRNDKDESLPRIPSNPTIDENEKPEILSGEPFWNKIKELHQKGILKGDYREYEKPYYNLLKGEHYYEIEDAKKGSIVCTSCPVRHGGILESHLLARYKVEDGVLYLDDQAINKAPKRAKIDK
jgi:hypothetical protein